MTPQTQLPSTSGARLAGDDFQHAVTWVHALKLLLPDSGVTAIEFEADDKGNVDDLVVYSASAPTVYVQIKFAVAQLKPLTQEWFVTKPRKGSKKTPLVRFYDSFKKLTAETGVPAELVLYTNRIPAFDDPILKCVAGQDCKVALRLFAATPESASGKARRAWADHLGVDEADLHGFLNHLSIRAGRESSEELEDRAAGAMRSVGFKSDLGALMIAVGALRKLIVAGARKLDADIVRDIARTYALVAAPPRATLLIQCLRFDSWPEAATVAIDWVDLFDGDEPGSRRQLRDPAGWNSRLKPELERAVERIRRARLVDVDIRGTMRLACGVLVGQLLSEVAGFRVSVVGRQGEWSSSGPRDAGEISREVVSIGNGASLAVALAISQPIAMDVVAYIRKSGLPVGALIVYAPSGGPNRDAVNSPSHGLGFAATISAALRTDTTGYSSLHLFQACPLPLAIMVGHLWNRMPSTVVYDDLGPGAGYTPTFALS